MPLGGQTSVVCQADGLEIQCTEDTRQIADLSYWASRVGSDTKQQGEWPRFAAVLARLKALRANGVACTHFDPTLETKSDGLWQIKGPAEFADGAREEWILDGDPAHETLTWVRRGHDEPTAMTLQLATPRQSAMLEFWQTGSAGQIVNEAVPNVQEGTERTLAVEREREALFYSVIPLNSFRLGLDREGRLEIAKGEILRDRLPSQPDWAADKAGKMHERSWDAQWSAPATKQVTLTLNWGIAAATRSFVGRKALAPADLSADFGPFYYQMFLGCLPLNLRRFGDYVAPRANVLMANVECYKDTWSRDNTWAYDSLYLVDPQNVAESDPAIYGTGARAAPSGITKGSPMPILVEPGTLKGYPGSDDTAAEMLLLAGRHFLLTGDREFARRNLATYRKLGEFLLNLRPAGSALPIAHGSWDAQGILVGQEPYFVADCFAALGRLALIEEALGDRSASRRWRKEAKAMRQAALTDYRQGGLWHSERGTFINYNDYKDPALAGPRVQSHAPMDKLAAKGTAHTEFLAYETIVPIWLGLLDDPAQVRRAYAWIDAHYSYASGQGGASFPPGIGQSSIALLDVCVRQQYGIGGADRLMQLIADHACDGGIPLTETAYGAYGAAGPSSPDGAFAFYRHTHTGRIWDNSPYFSLVMKIHYGLDYDYRGWKLADPRPLANYPLTTVSGLRHGRAQYAIRWKGRGRIRTITLDGKPWGKRHLDLTDGEHKVVVALGE